MKFEQYERVMVIDDDGKMSTAYYVRAIVENSDIVSHLVAPTASAIEKNEEDRFQSVGIYDFSGVVVCKYEELDDETVEDWCLGEQEQAKALIEEWYEKNRPGQEYKLEFFDSEITLDGVTLSPIAVKVRGIGKVREFPGWQLTDYKVHYGGRNQPDEMEDIPVSEHRNTMNAVCALLQFVAAQAISGWFEWKGEEG